MKKGTKNEQFLNDMQVTGVVVPQVAPKYTSYFFAVRLKLRKNRK